MFNMRNKDYKKVNLRDFRHNMTELRDSGHVYEVMKKGDLFGYFVPARYEVEVKDKRNASKKEFQKILKNISGKAQIKDEVAHMDDYDEMYRYLLTRKHLK